MKQIVYIFVLIFIAGCSATRKLDGIYSFRNDQRAVSIKFLNDSVCEITQNFYCDKVPAEFQSTRFACRYDISIGKTTGLDNKFRKKEIKFKKLHVRNLDASITQRYIVIPDYDVFCIESVVPNSNDDKLRKKLKYIDGTIFNLLNDTLILSNDRIGFDYLTLSKEK